jgi:hypothetical protein
MEITIETLDAMQRHGLGLFGWCCDCGFPSRYWEDVKARRVPRRAMFDTDVVAFIRERGESSPVIGIAPPSFPRCGSRHTETRITSPAKRRD